MSTIKMGNVGATAIATPPPGQVTIFINASNADHVSAKDSNGTVYDLTLGSGGSGLTAGNGITLGTGNTIDLGGALTQPITIISGSSTETLDIGGNTSNNLGQVRINSTSYQGNHLTAYDGTGAGTLININPGEFSSTNNINPATRSQIINGANNSVLYFTSNKIFRLYLDAAGIAPGSGESFTINGVTFTEGIDFTGQGNNLLDAATITGLNYTGIANFVSVTDEGSGSVKFIFSNPAYVSETLSDGYFLVFNWQSSVQTNNDGVQLEIRDVYGIPYTTLLMGDSETIFTDNSASPKGIQYNGFGEIDETGATADYSSLVGISLVPKVWVEGQLGSKANWADIYEQITVTNTTHNVGTERTIFADSSSNSITINLPAASTNAGKMLTVKKINAANTVTLDGNGSENIDGAATYAMTTNYDKVTVQCNGTQWFIIA